MAGYSIFFSHLRSIVNSFTDSMSAPWITEIRVQSREHWAFAVKTYIQPQLKQLLNQVEAPTVEQLISLP